MLAKYAKNPTSVISLILQSYFEFIIILLLFSTMSSIPLQTNWLSITPSFATGSSANADGDVDGTFADFRPVPLILPL